MLRSSSLSWVVLGFLFACSSSEGGGGSGAPGSSGGDGSNGGAPPGQDAPATWKEVAIDPGFAVTDIAGDARSVWVALGERDPKGTWTEKVARIEGDALVVQHMRTKETIIAPNYAIAGLAPLSADTAVIGGEWFLTRVGAGGDVEMGGSASYITSVYGRGDDDVWAGSRVGTLAHATGPKTAAIHRLADDGGIGGIWQSGSTLFLVTWRGIRAVTLPIPSAWNGATQQALAGEYWTIGGAGDAAGVAAGKGGLVATWDGSTWQRRSSGTTKDLRAVAVRSRDDAWAVGEDVLLHWDGAAWSTITGEAGMPSGGSGAAIDAKGVLWIASQGKLFRRSPGPATGVRAPADVEPADGGACGAYEPNDTYATATEIALPKAISACAPANDTDEYTFVTPSGAAGGFVSIVFTDVDGSQPLASLSVGTSETWFARPSGAAGDVRYAHRALAPSTRHYVGVSPGIKQGSTSPYLLGVSFTPFDDAFEPNDKDSESKKIVSGTPIEALFPTLVPRGDRRDDADWYLAQRPAGAFHVTVSNVAATSRAKISAFRVDDPLNAVQGVPLGSQTGNPGETVVFAGSFAQPAWVRVKIEDVGPRALEDAAPPAAFTQKYRLLVGD
jgi:hypothetical protein